MKYFSFLFVFIILTSCNQNNEIQTLSKFKIENIQDSVIQFNYFDAYTEGFKIPSKLQNGDTVLIFSFEIFNPNDTDVTYYYKSFYQNDSYKFPELLNNGNLNPLASENFYGSYSNTNIEFKKLLVKAKEKVTVKDSLRIIGNPRNETKYINRDIRKYIVEIPKEVVESKIIEIKNNKDWYNNIVTKAKNNNLSVDIQLELDAKYILEQSEVRNNRFQRNPRVGYYSFMSVALTDKQYSETPDYIKNISKTNHNEFVNPFAYFNDNLILANEPVSNISLNRAIKVKAQVPLNGIYIHPKYQTADTSYYNKYVGKNEELWKGSAMQFHQNYVKSKDPIDNVNVLSQDYYSIYTQEQYRQNGDDKSNRLSVYFTNTNQHGKTYGYDSLKNRIWFFNPAATKENLIKESVGLRTRHGLTYGTYTFKIKMAELLNKHQVWNGLTNAIWMVTESLEPWNSRRYVQDVNKGYMPFYGATKEYPRVNSMSYTEIDFEILKAPLFWQYGDTPNKDPEDTFDKVVLACTNWDMACKFPKKFNTGVKEINYLDKTFITNRWDEWYNAFTSKVPISDDEVFGADYYYFQLEWKPTEIIWRIGPSKDKLRVVGYMNDEYTSIPNNQMLCTITQEYHYTWFWPGMKYLQENIPFIGDDQHGFLYSIEIE